MKINLLNGSLTYGTVTIFSRIAAIILMPILTRILSPEEYGTLSIALTLVLLANAVVTLEVAQGVTVRFAVSNSGDRKLYPSTAIRFMLIMYLILFVVINIFGNMISRLVFSESIGSSILIAGTLLVVANGIFLLMQNQFRLELLSRDYAILTLSYVLLTSIGAISGAVFFQLPTVGIILGQAGGAALVDVVGIFMLRNTFSGGFHTDKLKEMLKYSLPVVPAGLLLLGGQQAQKFILSKYGSLEDVGIYGLAYQIAGFSALAVLGVQTAITPSVLAHHDDAETPKMLGRLFERFATVALILCAFLSVFSKELVTIFSAASYRRAEEFVPYLAFAIALNCFYIFFPGKLIRAKSAAQLIASSASFLIAVSTGFLLIKFDGVRGAALSTLLSSATFFFIWYYTSQRLYRVPVDWMRLLKSTAWVAVACYVGIFIIPTSNIFFSFAIKSGLMLILFCVVARDYFFEWWKRPVSQP